MYSFDFHEDVSIQYVTTSQVRTAVLCGSTFRHSEAQQVVVFWSKSLSFIDMSCETAVKRYSKFKMFE